MRSFNCDDGAHLVGTISTLRLLLARRIFGCPSYVGYGPSKSEACLQVIMLGTMRRNGLIVVPCGGYGLKKQPEGEPHS